jgi:hypothetical protein
MSDRSLMRASVAISASALCLAVVVLLGRFVERPSAPASARPPSSAAAQPAVPVRRAPPPPAAAQPNVPVRQPPPSTGQHADDRFWRLMEETRSAAGNDTGRQSGLLKDRLTELSPQAIIDFDRTRHRLDRRAYTWKLWGAAMVIEDGCSDDCFRDFRAYLISLGRGPYEQALRNPDSLAPIVHDEEAGDWENADDVAPDAYSSVTGDDFPLDDSDLSGRPAGPQINMSEAALRRRYPRLAARFRHG